MILPDYQGACVTNVLPALVEHPAIGGDWLPYPVAEARQAVLVVIDGLGWHQLEARRHLTPRMNQLSGSSISTVAPSTTASALTSITTGAPPGEHGVVGYRIRVDGSLLNVLRWTTERGDAREAISASTFQGCEPFFGRKPVVISRSEFARSGFTEAHLAGGQFAGYRTTASLVLETANAVRDGERLVYAYYDGLDRIGHEYGHADHYDAELMYVDRMIGDLVDAMPAGTAVVVTADHGQVHTGDALHTFDKEVLAMVSAMSGEARFRWLHSRPGRRDELLTAARQHHGDDAWVVPRDQAIAEHWFGPVVTTDAQTRLGDVAVVAKGVGAFVDPADLGTGLIGRHGSLTPAEMLVPLLHTVT